MYDRCPQCGEEVYKGMVPRHMAKDHNPQDDATFELAEKLQEAAAREGYTLITSRSLNVAQYLSGQISILWEN